MAAEGCGAAKLDRRHHPALCEAKAAGVRSAPRLAVAAEDVRQQFEGTLDLPYRIEGHACVAGRGGDVPVSQQVLDHPDVDALFEQMGGKAMSQRMHRNRWIEVDDADRLATSPLQRPHGDRPLWIGSRE